MKKIKALAVLLLCVAMLTACENTATPGDTTADASSAANTTVDTTVNDSTNDATTAKPEDTTTAKPADTTTAKPAEKQLGAVAKYRLYDLPVDRAVQQFALLRNDDGLYIFAVQRVNSTTYLSRLLVGNDGVSARVIDSVMLDGYGHGESFDLAVIDGNAYLYVASGANSIVSYAWATTVTRLRYDEGRITDERVISGFQYASATGKILHSDATPYRINFALDTDSDMLVFYIRTDKNKTGKNGYSFLTAYRLSEINAMLDNRDISLADATGAFLGTTGAKTVSDICYNSSFQGLEVDDGGNIYVVGGGTKTRPQLTRFALENGKINRKKVTDIDWIETGVLRNRNFAAATSFVEIEGLTYFEGALYCSFNPSVSSLSPQDCTEIYLVSER